MRPINAAAWHLMTRYDYAIVAAYVVGMIALGTRYGRHAADSDYSLDGRTLGWFSLGMSTMATQWFAVSVVSAPAFVGLRADGSMRWLSFELAVPIAMNILMAYLGPILPHSGVVSAYSFVEQRLGGRQRFLKHVERSRLRVLDFHRTGFAGLEFGFGAILVGGPFLYVVYYGTDQTQAQRILSAKYQTTMRRLLLFTGLRRFPITLLYCVWQRVLGALIGTCTGFRALIPTDKPDLMMPVFIAHNLPHGIL